MRTPPPPDLDLSIEEDLGHQRITYRPRGPSGARTLRRALLAAAALSVLAAALIAAELLLVAAVSAGMAWVVGQVEQHTSGTGAVELTPTHLIVTSGTQRVALLLEEIVSVRVVPMSLELTCADGSRRYVLSRSGSTLAGWLAPRIEERVAQRRAVLLAEGHDLAQVARPPEQLHALRNPTPP